MTNPATPPKGGMPKWLIILLVVLLVIILGCCGGIVTCNILLRKAVNTAAPALQSAMESATRAATQKITDEMRAQGMEVDTTGAGLTVPAEMPSDVPIYEGFKIQVKIVPPGKKEGAINLMGKAPTATLREYYEKQMASRGWKQESATTTGDTFVQTYSKDKQTVNISGGGPTDEQTLQISFSTRD